MKRFNRKIAIVTGAARGIGKATSLRFKKEGFTVIETDILPDSENKGVSEKPQMEPKGETMIHDVSDEASWSELIESVFKKFFSLYKKEKPHHFKTRFSLFPSGEYEI